jgi:hypothetical protein
VAVGDEKSTIRLWATFYLREAGIPMSNIKPFEPPTDDVIANAARLRDAPRQRQGAKISDHSAPLQAVLSRACEAGAVSEKIFQRALATNAPLVLLKRFPSSPVFWLASSSLPKEIASSLRTALINLRDPQMFNRLADRVTSYSEVTESDLTRLQQAASLLAEQATENEEKE